MEYRHHVPHVPSEVVDGIGVEPSALGRKPQRQRHVVQRDHGLDAVLVARVDHLAVVQQLRFGEAALRRLDAGPFDGEAVHAQSGGGEHSDVLAVAMVAVGRVSRRFVEVRAFGMLPGPPVARDVVPLDLMRGCGRAPNEFRRELVLFFHDMSFYLMPGDALDEVALQEYEQKEDWGDHQYCSGEQDAVVRGVLAGRVEGQGYRQRVLLLGLGRDQRPQEVVPGGQEREDGQRRQRRSTLGQDNLEEYAQLAGTVDPRGLHQRVGDSGDELSHQEDSDGLTQERQDERRIGVRESHVRDDHEQRDERGHAWNHERHHDGAEQNVLASEVHLRQGVSDHGAEHHVPEDGDHGDDYAVGEVGAEVQFPEPFGEVRERGVLGQELRRFGEDLPLGLQRAQRHP